LSDSPMVVAHDEHNPALRHHFADMEQQREASEMGMWVFLITEIMFFGGMFLAYMVYRYLYYPAWVAGSEHMDFWWGTINTIVLICSSLTMALAVRSAQVGQRKMLVMLLIVTMLLGCVFLGIKAVEYHGHWVEHQFPGPGFHFEGPDPQHVELFFSLYWAMTGFHALHMLIGVVLVGFIAFFGWHGKYGPDYYNPVENTGLYWHFVDIVWIYLYPLLYLISHSHLH
jgi:cytochrome c oxidase subunit III